MSIAIIIFLVVDALLMLIAVPVLIRRAREHKKLHGHDGVQSGRHPRPM